MYQVQFFRSLLPGCLLSVFVPCLLMSKGVQGAPVKEATAKKDRKELVNSIGLKLVRIPNGKFKMGSSKKEQDTAIEWYVEEAFVRPSRFILADVRAQGPRHEVEITKEFWLGVYEVTQKQFKAVMGYNPSCFSTNGTGKAEEQYLIAPGEGKDKVKGQDTSDFPVENVSWDDAVDFCKKLTVLAAEKKAGRTYRLPTEAEWEYACRGGATSATHFHFGNSLSWKQANTVTDDDHLIVRPCKVGSYKPNGFGLFDMHGNVSEWCTDWYDKGYYGKSPQRDPQGPLKGSERVRRGGAWCDFKFFARTAHWTGSIPTIRDRDQGFRVVCVGVEKR